jgi:hypothetical protein
MGYVIAAQTISLDGCVADDGPTCASCDGQAGPLIGLCAGSQATGSRV